MSYNVVDAAKDLITGNLDIADEATVQNRAALCHPCDANVAGICTACGCVIQLKVKLVKTECPIGFW